MKRILLLLTIVLTGFGSNTQAQNTALKTNLLSDAFLNPNLGLEVKLAPKWTFDVSGQLNAWKINDRRWKHWLVQPEARYWFCRAFSGHFLGIHAHGGQYNVGGFPHARTILGIPFGNLKDSRYQGWFIGAGVAYGYTWILSRRWSFEAEIGVGYAYTRYDRYPCAKCGTRTAADCPYNYFGLTKAALNIVYNF